MRRPVVIFDADDTLWATETLYDKALASAQLAVERAGIDGRVWRERQRQIDLEAAARLKFSVERFPRSSVRAYQELAESPDRHIEKAIYEASKSVFDAKADLIPGAASVLSSLQPDYSLALLTKGERTVQHKRVAESGLVDFFDVVAIVDHKRPSSFASICALLEVDVAEAVSVGNSLRSDILPAVDAGLRALWIDAYVWEHERQGNQVLPEAVTQLKGLVDVPAAVAAIHLGFRQR